MLGTGQDDIKPRFIGITKATAQPRYTPQRQQRYNRTTGICTHHNDRSGTTTEQLVFCDSHGAFASVTVCSVHHEIITADNRQPRHDTRFKLLPLLRPRTSPLCMGVLPSLLLFLRYHSSPQGLRSHGTTAALQASPFVTATYDASACVHLCINQ